MEDKKENGTDGKKLQSPQCFVYNEADMILTWQSVPWAESYIIRVTDSEGKNWLPTKVNKQDRELMEVQLDELRMRLPISAGKAKAEIIAVNGGTEPDSEPSTVEFVLSEADAAELELAAKEQAIMFIPELEEQFEMLKRKVSELSSAGNPEAKRLSAEIEALKKTAVTQGDLGKMRDDLTKSLNDAISNTVSKKDFDAFKKSQDDFLDRLEGSIKKATDRPGQSSYLSETDKPTDEKSSRATEEKKSKLKEVTGHPVLATVAIGLLLFLVVVLLLLMNGVIALPQQAKQTASTEQGAVPADVLKDRSALMAALDRENALKAQIDHDREKLSQMHYQLVRDAQTNKVVHISEKAINGPGIIQVAVNNSSIDSNVNTVVPGLVAVPVLEKKQWPPPNVIEPKVPEQPKECPKQVSYSPAITPGQMIPTYNSYNYSVAPIVRYHNPPIWVHNMGASYDFRGIRLPAPCPPGLRNPFSY